MLLPAGPSTLDRLKDSPWFSRSEANILISEKNMLRKLRIEEWPPNIKETKIPRREYSQGSSQMATYKPPQQRPTGGLYPQQCRGRRRSLDVREQRIFCHRRFFVSLHGCQQCTHSHLTGLKTGSPAKVVLYKMMRLNDRFKRTQEKAAYFKL
jgi:hypothetical protein